MIDRLSSGGLIVTYSCTAACRHCLYKSSPRRDAAYMDPDVLRPMLHKAASLGCRSFHIGGGEPFLDFNALLAVVETMQDEGAAVEYLETNAAWFDDSTEARRMMRELAAAGVGTVMVSICPFHIEFVPLEKAEGALAACRETGMGSFIWQDQFRLELSRLDPSATHSHDELRAIFGESYVLDAARRYGLTLNGRALRSFAPVLERRSAEDVIAANPGGCAELGCTGHFHLDLYGNYIPPGCLGFTVDCRDLGSSLDEDRYRRFLAAAREGVDGLYRMAADEAGFQADPEGYVSKCHLCEEARAALVEQDPAACRDLGPSDFYSMA